MELTLEEIEQKGSDISSRLSSLGYVQTATGDGLANLFFLKKFNQKVNLHAMVFLKRNTVTLDIIGMLDYGISLRGLDLPLDSNLLEKTEDALLNYMSMLLDTGRPEEVKTITAPPKKEVVPIEERNKAFWDLIRQEGKAKGYEKEMCLEFYNYWTECNPGGKKVRWEKETTFQVDRRLGTWLRNDKKWNSRYTTIQEKKATQELENLKTAGTNVINTKDLF